MAVERREEDLRPRTSEKRVVEVVRRERSQRRSVGNKKIKKWRYVKICEEDMKRKYEERVDPVVYEIGSGFEVHVRKKKKEN